MIMINANIWTWFRKVPFPGITMLGLFGWIFPERWLLEHYREAFRSPTNKVGFSVSPRLLPMALACHYFISPHPLSDLMVAKNMGNGIPVILVLNGLQSRPWFRVSVNGGTRNRFFMAIKVKIGLHSLSVYSLRIIHWQGNSEAFCPVCQFSLAKFGNVLRPFGSDSVNLLKYQSWLV